MTEPPAKATFKAGANPVLAACVVRLLALVATRIPKNPANPDVKAPVINESAINALDSEFPTLAKPNSAATTTIKTANTRYSAFKKDMAPSAILEPILSIFSVP